MDKLLTVDEVADLLSVTPACIRKWVHLGFIPAVKLGRLVRFEKQVIERWVKEKSDPGRSTRRIMLESV